MAQKLVHANDTMPGFTRRGEAGHFFYVHADGKRLNHKGHLARIQSLVIPPAWTDVWIAPDGNHHLQATGRDARGRKQYRYHPDYRDAQEADKFEHILEFARALPQIRSRALSDMRKAGLPRTKVLGAIVTLLETTLIRVGNEDYARANKSYGLTTLRDRHAAIEGATVRFVFKGKSGRDWRLKLTNKRVAKIVRSAQDLPGQHLFQYLDDNGNVQKIGSSDVNAYLRDISGADISAKDFRTWAGTVLAATALSEFEAVDSQASAQRNIRAAIESVAARLGNTPTICRKCYVHPEIVSRYLDDDLKLAAGAEVTRLLRGDLKHFSPEEAAVLASLSRRVRTKARAVSKRNKSTKTQSTRESARALSTAREARMS